MLKEPQYAILSNLKSTIKFKDFQIHIFKYFGCNSKLGNQRQKNVRKIFSRQKFFSNIAQIFKQTILIFIGNCSEFSCIFQVGNNYFQTMSVFRYLDVMRHVAHTCFVRVREQREQLLGKTAFFQCVTSMFRKFTVHK